MPFEVPEGWVWCRLGDVISIKSGDSIRVRDNRQGEYPIYGGNGINGYYSDCNVEPDTIVIGRVGFYCGSVHQTISKAWVTDNAFIVSCESVFNSKYLCHLLEWLQLSKTSNSTAQPVISGKGIYPLLIPLPPLYEQERIVSEVKRCFTLIAQIEQGKSDLQTIIKQAKSKILDLAIHGKLVPQDPNDEPAIELLKRINPDFTPCDNGHYQNLPIGWAMCKLSDLCRIENGFAFSSNDYKPQGIPLVRISNIIHNTIDITDCAYIEGVTDNKFKISKGDLLIAMSGATTGKMGVYPFDETAYLNQRVGNIKILNTSLLLPNYRNTYMQSKVDEILKIAYGGAQPNISASVIGNFDFPLPSYKEQIRIVETVQRIFGQLDVITESL